MSVFNRKMVKTKPESSKPTVIWKVEKAKKSTMFFMYMRTNNVKNNFKQKKNQTLLLRIRS